ncbi:calcium-activated chloride channel regulator 1-like [Lytechinus variegatus]|uniref:calcium-activated chloride channel regulator 1-like n=1 Tax=Lytechinus variegatus TaxID=7654 RepID=UPI001BB1EABF|nr:calcium-activated chloride channel regulator 1-like [Lytechinus variegatus]
MHMTPKYIIDEEYREDKFGNTDRVLVRTWGYYRWGLFKEHYDGKGGALAYDSPYGATEGTRCSLKIKGNLEMPEGSPCQRSPNNANSGYHPDCRFVPETQGQTATASLLFAPRGAHIHSVEDFCEEDSHPDSVHNPLADNIMNINCGGDSAWKVMLDRTTDFRDGVSLISNTTPRFEVLQVSSVRSVVLVLDISGSMAGNRFARMIQSSIHYIMNIIPENSKLGIVTFSTDAAVRASLTDITDPSSREGLVNDLPSGTTGTTCIGCGILKGIEVLGSFAEGGYLLLLSDGGENVYPYIEDTYDDIEEAGVIIDTITISNAADPKMEDLSTRTSGLSSFCSDTGTGTCLQQAFQRTITERPDIGTETVPTQIYVDDLLIKPIPGIYSIPVVIDEGLGNDTVVTVAWTQGGNLLHVILTGPNGTTIGSNYPGYHHDNANDLISINIPFTQAGLWNLTIKFIQVEDHASISVTSKPTTLDYSPITVTALLGSPEVNFTQNPALAIYALVQKDYLPVLNADVTAIISDSSSTTTMELLDNGAGSDLSKDDGTYSGYFLDFTSNGRYNVKIDALGYSTMVESPDILRVKRDAQFEGLEEATAPSFMRTASGGVFKVEGYSPNATDILPPSRIQDLVYTSFSYDNSTVTLSWTAVGDDLDQGTAFKYEFRYSTNFSSVRTNFSNCVEITQDEIVYGNLSNINPSGVTETITVTLPERGQDIVYYFAIRAGDETGNVGELSNIASLSIRYIPVTKDPTKPENLGIIIGVCCGVGALIILGAILLYIHHRKSSKVQVGPEKPEEGLPTTTVEHDDPSIDNPIYSTK